MTRKKIYLAGGAAAVAVAGVLLGRQRGKAHALETAHAELATRFKLSHEALRRNLARLAATGESDPLLDTDAFGEFVGVFGDFLVMHHQVEDEVLFPALREHGRLRTTDAAHLERWGAEHRDVNALAGELGSAGSFTRSAGRAGLPRIARLARELQQALDPHFTGEEELIHEARLREMVPASAVLGMQKAAAALSGDQLKMAAFLAHSLEPDEQHAVFGTAPWFFRKVILPTADGRLFTRFKPFSVTADLAI